MVVAMVCMIAFLVICDAATAARRWPLPAISYVVAGVLIWLMTLD